MRKMRFFRRTEGPSQVVEVKNTEGVVIANSEPAEVVAAPVLESWKVRWHSPKEFDDHIVRVNEHCEFFTSEEMADAFAESLTQAFRVIQAGKGWDYGIKVSKSVSTGVK